MTEYFAQFGEDEILWEFFNHRRDGYFVEVGANHPTWCSQTCFLERQGWKGILIEPLPENCALLRQQRPGSTVYQNACGAQDETGESTFFVAKEMNSLSGLTKDEQREYSEIKVNIRTLDDILAESSSPEIDLLSIDVEGTELNVLKGFSIQKYRPKVMLLEDHLQSLSLHRYVVSTGYKLVKRTGCNSWYVPSGSHFSLSTASERFALKKEIYLDSPIRTVRFALKRRFTRRPQNHH